jgi:RNA polymerase sigma-70 factor (ECF subfamily)
MGRQRPQSDPLVLSTDEELLRRFRGGQAEAFGLLVRRYQQELYGYLRRYLNDAALAEDVFQNTFLQLYQKADQYQADRPVRPWLYTIATHQAIDALRRAGRRPTVSLDQLREVDPKGESQSLLDVMEAAGGDPFEHLEEAERRDRVRQSLAELPEHLRSTVILAYYQGLKYREIAEILGIPVGTVKSRLHVALGKLQASWQPSDSVHEEV